MSGPAANSTFCDLRHAGGYNYAYNRTLQDAIAYGKDVLHQTNNQFTITSIGPKTSTSSGVNLTWGVREPIMLYPLFTLCTPFYSRTYTMYTRYTCIYTMYTPNTPLNTPLNTL